MQNMFSTQYGSRLYGTATPTSDVDWKTIVLPDHDDLLLGKKLVNKFKTTNSGGRNDADDVDQEFIPLQIFFRDFYAGQTYAIELAFAIDGTHAEQQFFPTQWVERERGSLVYHMIVELRERFLTSNVKAMVGYATHQASLYSLKGERLNMVEAVERALVASTGSQGDVKLSSVDPSSLLRLFELHGADDGSKYFKWGEYQATQDKVAPCFFLLEKCFPLSITFNEALQRVKDMLKQYGSRAKSAAVDNVDWKALMHAVRVSDQALELLNTHKLVFPFKEDHVARLLSIKRGEHSLNEISAELADKLEQIKTLQPTCGLPDRTPELDAEFEAFCLRWLRFWYN